jgi:N-acyl-D-amino-acid deacylase
VATELNGNALVKGGQIVDGTGAKPFVADVRIADGRVVEIGANLDPGMDRVYDASGCYVTPGFIDTHTHYDGSLFWDPSCDPIIQHGVTTLMIGNCGLGLAPVRKEAVSGLAHLFSYIEDLPRDVFEAEIPWSWETFPEYAAEMKSRKFGVNVVALVSHSLLRTYEIGDEAWKRASSGDEASRISLAFADAMKAGAFGFSTSRFDRSPAGDLVPSYYSDKDELEALFEVTAKHRGIVQLIPDMGDLDAQEDDLRELGDFSARHGGVPVISNAIYQRPDDPEYAPRLVSVGKDIQAKGGKFFYLASPRSIELLVNFHQCMTFIYVPAWNEVVQPDMPREEKKRRLADPAWRAQAKADWDAVKEGFPSGGMSRLFRIVTVGNPDYEKYLGKNFDVVLDERGGHPSDVLADWALENDLEAEFVYPFTNTDIAEVGRLLASEVSLISASDAGAHIGMFDGAGDTTLILTRHVRDRNDMTLETAVKRMTRDQAELLRLKDRGTLEVGAIADIAVFDLAALHWDVEQKVDDIPGGRSRFRRPEGGFRYTFVSGVLAQENGKLTGALPARFLTAEDRVAA